MSRQFEVEITQTWLVNIELLDEDIEAFGLNSEELIREHLTESAMDEMIYGYPADEDIDIWELGA